MSIDCFLGVSETLVMYIKKVYISNSRVILIVLGGMQIVRYYKIDLASNNYTLIAYE